jgi:hypothetical protein
VLVLLGSDTKPYATRSARHVADHVASARVHEIPGAGHASPLTTSLGSAAARPAPNPSPAPKRLPGARRPQPPRLTQ